MINDPVVDALVEKGRTTPDEATRMEAYTELAKVLTEEANNFTILYDTMRVGTTNSRRYRSGSKLFGTRGRKCSFPLFQEG